MGGEKVFANMLDSVFIVPPVFDDSYYGQVIHEIREMTVMNMGNYAQQGAHQSNSEAPSGPPTTAIAVKLRSPSLTALKKAVRSAQFVGV